MANLTKRDKEYAVARLQGTATHHIAAAEQELMRARLVIAEIVALLKKRMEKPDG